MGQKTVIKDCPQCGRGVRLNGIGSSRSSGQRLLTQLVGFILPFTCDRFRPASDWHDMAVHQGPKLSEWFVIWRTRVDKTFYDMCMAEADKAGNWFSRMYFKGKARELYEALEFNDGDGYPIKQCNH